MGGRGRIRLTGEGYFLRQVNSVRAVPRIEGAATHQHSATSYEPNSQIVDVVSWYFSPFLLNQPTVLGQKLRMFQDFVSTVNPSFTRLSDCEAAELSSSLFADETVQGQYSASLAEDERPLLGSNCSVGPGW